MTPIFDKGSNVVAWFNGEHVFDADLNWVAFVRNGHVFSAASHEWLGPIREGSFQDTSGRPVGWLQGSQPSGGLRPLSPLRPLQPLTPLRPLQPLMPLRPLQPLTPLGGWSTIEWGQYIAR